MTGRELDDAVITQHVDIRGGVDDLVVAVIVGYNTRHPLGECIASLKKGSIRVT